MGFSPSDCAQVEGEYSCLLADSLPTVEFAEAVAECFHRIAVKPVRAAVCTHVHPDHIGGVRAFGSEEQVHSGGIEIVALDELSGHRTRGSGPLAAVLTHRALYAVYGCAR